LSTLINILSCCRSVPIEGFSDDYAFLIQGLLDLYETCHDLDLLKWAELLQTKQNDLFWDEEHGGYFTSPAGDSSVILRMKSGGFVSLT